MGWGASTCPLGPRVHQIPGGLFQAARGRSLKARALPVGPPSEAGERKSPGRVGGRQVGTLAGALGPCLEGQSPPILLGNPLPTGPPASPALRASVWGREPHVTVRPQTLSPRGTSLGPPLPRPREVGGP